MAATDNHNDSPPSTPETDQSTAALFTNTRIRSQRSTWPSEEETDVLTPLQSESVTADSRSNRRPHHTRMNTIDFAAMPETDRSSRHVRSFSIRRLSTLLTGGKNEDEKREIELNPERKGPAIDSRTGSPFVKNNITTSRYNLLNFLPKQLYAQFSKVANLYFLFMSILQLVPGWSPTGQFTTIIPLSVFISIAMAHEAFDDYKRHKQDTTENNSECNVLRVYDSTSTNFSCWKPKKWKDLEVGDYVSITAQEWIPADLLLLHSEGEEGTCYVETAALDGETNLKQKQALKETSALLSPSTDKALAKSTDEALAKFKAKVITEDPNQDLYNFDGSILLPDGTQLPLTTDQVLLRGTILRNTPRAYGLVIFAGEETKLRMNASKNIRTKAPIIQKTINKVVMILFSIVIGLSASLTILAHSWEVHVGKKVWYIVQSNRDMATTVFGFIILFNTMIPISLYVTMEIIKLAQIYFINNDLQMYHEASDTPAEARTSTINEDLGQVSYLFSDKTGTLTDNIMLFRKMSVGGYAFMHDLDLELEEQWRMKRSIEESETASGQNLDRRGSTRSGHFSMIAPAILRSSLYHRSSTSSSKSLNGRFHQMRSTRDLLTIIQHQSCTQFSERTRWFLLAIALCHTCVPEVDQETREILYQAASPDEFALVTAAKELGYVVTNRSLGSVSLKINDNGPDETFQILNVIEFSSKRKRMSVIVRLPGGRICLICKGADSVILERLAPNLKDSQDKKENYPNYSDKLDQFSSKIDTSHNIPVGTMKSSDLARKLSTKSAGPDDPYDMPSDEFDLFPIADKDWLHKKTMYHIQAFATEGLRTLLYGHRYLGEEEYAQWNKVYQEASIAIADRQTKLEEAAELIERDLEITGATAIEDKLQEGVPDTIDKLRRAGIKVWMLTGDKRETAINVGHSCSLVKSDSTLIVFDSEAKLKEELRESLRGVRKGRIQHPVAVVDGAVLMTIENDPHLLDYFVDFGVLCEAVICCRVSPCQKALVVRSVREKLKDKVVLAIGDGANDIAMIQEAHVGIGITGREGLQAARSSDYSIAQFRFLSHLLFVHGRWSYVRVSKFMLGTFYKCMCFYLTQGIFQFFTGFSGTSLYEQWTLSFYNTLFSSLPVIVIGMFEKDLERRTLLKVPQLYSFGQHRAAFNLRVFFSWISAGIYHAFVVTAIPFLLHGYFEGYELFGEHGSPQLYELGLEVYTSVVFVVTLKIAYVECHNRTLVTHFTSFVTMLGWFIYQVLYSLMYPRSHMYEVRGTFQYSGSHPGFWAITALTVALALLPNYLVKIVKAMVFPTDADTYQEFEKNREFKKILDADNDGVSEKNHANDLRSDDTSSRTESSTLTSTPAAEYHRESTLETC